MDLSFTSSSKDTNIYIVLRIQQHFLILNNFQGFYKESLVYQFTSCSHVTMTITFNYTTSFIKSIRELAKVKSLFSYFHLDQPICSRIIALGIRSRPRKYRRSRGGRDHFYKIFSLDVSEDITFQQDPIKDSRQMYSLLIAKTCT